MVLVEYGNINMLRVGEKWSVWLAILMVGILIEGHCQKYGNFWLSIVVPVHVSEKQGEINVSPHKTPSLTQAAIYLFKNKP